VNDERQIAKKKWRFRFILSLIILYALLLVFAFIVLPGQVSPLIELGNVKIPLPLVVTICLDYATWFSQYWWAVGVLFGLTGFVASRGKLDRILPVFTFLSIVTSLVIIFACIRTSLAVSGIIDAAG